MRAVQARRLGRRHVSMLRRRQEGRKDLMLNMNPETHPLVPIQLTSSSLDIHLAFSWWLMVVLGSTHFQLTFSSLHSGKESVKRTSNLTFSWHSLLSLLHSLLGVIHFAKWARNQTELGLMDALQNGAIRLSLTWSPLPHPHFPYLCCFSFFHRKYASHALRADSYMISLI